MNDIRKIKYRVTPEILNSEEFQLITETNSYLDGQIKEISREVYNLRDEAIRQCLIKLGWTPPIHTKDQLDNMKKAREDGSSGDMTTEEFLAQCPEEVRVKK